MSVEIGEVKGQVVVVMAPTGGGKGTVIRHALTTFPELERTVSCTSRAPRPGEQEGEHYHFISREEFDEKITDGEFLEWADFAGNRYGTLKSEIVPRLQEGKVVIAEIDIQGVEQLLELLDRKHITITYIDAGDWEVLKERALARAPISEEDLAKRYERFLIEEEAKPIADVIIDNKGAVEETLAAFEEVVKEAYKKVNA